MDYTPHPRPANLFDEILERRNSEGTSRTRAWTPGRLVYLVGVLLTTAVVLTVISSRTPISSLMAREVLVLFILLSVLSCVAQAISAHVKSLKEYIKNLILVTALCAPIAAMVLLPISGYRQAAFWVSLVVWLMLALLEVKDKAEQWERFLLVLGTIWTVSGVIVTIGKLPPFYYSREAVATTTALHAFLDVRLASGLLFGAFCLLTAVVRAFSVELPRTPNIKAWSIGKKPLPNQGIFAPIFVAFSQLADEFIQFVHAITNVLSKAAMALANFFMAVGDQLLTLFRALVKRDVLIPILRILAKFFLLLLIVGISAWTADPSYTYLRSSALGVEVENLLGLLALGIVVFLAIAGLVRLERGTEGDLHDNLLIALYTHVSLFFLTGLLLHVLSSFNYFGIVGFGVASGGPFTLLTFLLVVGGLVVAFRKSHGANLGEADAPNSTTAADA